MAARERCKGVWTAMKAIGGSNIWVEYAGVKNTAVGAEMLSMPTRPHPARKGELIDVPGRNGKLFMDDGAYDRVLVSVRLMVPSGEMDAVHGWLTGSGLLRFGDDPSRAYNASVTKEFSVSNRFARLRGQEFSVTFDCEPFRYVYPSPADVTISTSGGTITNPGTVFSQPKLKITGSGDFTVVVNGYSIDGRSITGGAIVDCELQETFTPDETQSLNGSFVMDEFPVLKPGTNAITWTGDVTKIEITPRWRYL